MRVKRRRKSSRFRGSHTHGRGFKKKARGSGHQGGKGMAGTGKRGDQKKTLVLTLYGSDYFGKDKALRRGKKVEIKTITLRTIIDNMNSFVKRGVAKESKGGYELDLKDYKIIGNDAVSVTLKVHCLSATSGATAAIKKSGGEVIASKQEKEVKPESKSK